MHCFATECPSGWTKYRRVYCFKVKDGRKTWYKAKESCQQEDADLPSIQDAAMETFIISLIPENSPYWFGARSGVGGSWFWSDGSSWGNYARNKMLGKAGKCGWLDLAGEEDNKWRAGTEQQCNEGTVRFICHLELTPATTTTKTMKPMTTIKKSTKTTNTKKSTTTTNTKKSTTTTIKEGSTKAKTTKIATTEITFKTSPVEKTTKGIFTTAALPAQHTKAVLRITTGTACGGALVVLALILIILSRRRRQAAAVANIARVDENENYGEQEEDYYSANQAAVVDSNDYYEY